MNGYYVLSKIFLLIVLFSMVFYNVAPFKNDLGMLSKNGFTAVYSCVVILFGLLYKSLAKKITKIENHRYHKNYDDSLINRLFMFNFFNYYMPVFFASFYK